MEIERLFLRSRVLEVLFGLLLLLLLQQLQQKSLLPLLGLGSSGSEN